MCFYIFWFIPFSEKILNTANAFTELLITLIFSLIGVTLLEIPENTEKIIDNALFWLVNSILGIQMISSLIIFVKNVYAMIKARRENLKVRPTNVTEITTSKFV